MVTRKSNIINSIIVLKRLQNLNKKTTTLAPCPGSTVSKLKYALNILFACYLHTRPYLSSV